MANGIKTGGRVKGSINKKTPEKRMRAELILQLIEDTYFQKDIKKLTAAQRMALYADMMEYVVPKLTRTSIEGSINQDIVVTIKRNRT